ncbi:MAG: D-alanyl-D-alanine carboxypeptidase [Myxococcales bacterium]|nr:D-alanyl-D-alanine carboxypeptidase [Myxococcales bacterium]
MRTAAFVTSLLLWGLISGPAMADKPSELPEIKSRSAVVIDADTGAEIFAKDADSVRAIASTTKIFVAMAVRKHKIALDDWTEITRDDARAAKGGSRTRLDVGQSFRNHDLLRAMLISSDNRAPTALGRAAGMTRDQLIAAMNDVAKDLGLKKTKFTDSSGLRGNVSTAREMALALRAAQKDPVLAEIMGTTYYVVKSRSGANKIAYGSTNQPMVAGTYKVTGGKTGFTRAAGYCFITGAEIDGHRYLLAFLGAEAKATRFADFARTAAWLDAGAPGARIKPAPTAARAKATGARRRVKGTATR